MDKLSANGTIQSDYAEQLRKEHDGSKWGSTGARYSGEDLARVIASRPYLQTALDFGCGKGTLSQAFPELVWQEYDPGIPGKDHIPSGSFDLVTNTDVLEHVEPHLLDNVLLVLQDKTDKVLFLDIACYPTGKVFGEGPYVGQDLHLIIQDPEWWKERVCTAMHALTLVYFNSKEMLSKGKYKKRAILVMERV